MDKTTLTEIIVYSITATIHWIIAVYLLFIGSVISPQLSHQTASSIGFILLLPFSLLIFIEPLEKFDVVFGILGALLWGTFTY